MPRDVYLVRWFARPFKDHWAILVPSRANAGFGTLLQVEGDVRHGYTHSVTRNWDSTDSSRPPRLTLIGTVADQHVHDAPSAGAEITDQLAPRDDIEQAALSVAAPGPSMKPTSNNSPSTKRVTFSDCQWWVRQVVESLVQSGILAQTALQALDAVPKN